MSPTLPALPPVIERFIAATNAFDLDAWMDSFVEDAFVNDNHREFRGKAAIRAFAAREIVGDKVTMDVTEIRAHHGMVAVAAKVDGNYDKSKLPDPLILSFYFTLAGDKIATLIIIFNKPAP
jgi:ketosteroid isomerase-like protein